MSNPLRLLTCALISFTGAAADLPAADWPEFHGLNRDNKSTETGLLREWPEGGPKLLWTAAGIGKGYSSATIAKGMVYTAGMVDKQTFVFAFDLDGKPKWKTANGASWQATKEMRWAARFAGSRSTPTVHEGLVYHLGEQGRLAALDAKKGDEAWTLNLLDEFGATCPKYGLCESVIIDREKLICCPGGAKGYLVALDKKTGKLMWANTDVPGPVGYCSPIIVEFGGVRQVITLSAKALFGVDLASGKLLWSVAHGNSRNNSATDPIFHQGHVYASSGYGCGSVLVKLTPIGGGIKAEKVWSSKLMDNHHGGVLLIGDHLYGTGHRSRGWFCLDFMTGEQTCHARSKGSLTYADGRVYFLSERGLMSLLVPKPDAHEVVSSFKVPRGGEGAYWAHPVVCGGRLYLRHTDHLLAYQIKAQ